MSNETPEDANDVANGGFGSTPAAGRDGPKNWIVLAALLAVTGTVYAPIFKQSFLQYDDNLYITANAIVRRGLSLDGIRYAFTTTDLGNWHPLNWLSHMLDVQIFGLNAGAMKAVNLVLHLFNST